MAKTATNSGGLQSDHPSHNPRVMLAGVVEVPTDAARRLTNLARSTPGRLFGIALGITLLALLTGLIGALVVQGKKDSIGDLVDHREPLAAAAQQVYRSLSDADATAASAFLSTGTEPPELRQRYEIDIAQAGAALGKSAANSAGIADAEAKVDILNREIPVYTGLIETARANNRQGFPAGASYLREASELMRSKILPAAQDLYRIDTDRLTAEQDDVTDFPWLTTLLVLGLLAALIATQVDLMKRTNRLFNVGLVVATGAVIVLILWSTVALLVQSLLINNGQNEGTHQVDVLVRARISALQARADETLTLVARGDGAAYEKDFAALTIRLVGEDGHGGLLAEAKTVAAEQNSANQIDSAINNARSWLQAHNRVRELDTSGDYNAAVKLAIDPQDKDGAASAFLRLDQDLAAAINSGRQVFLDDTTGADHALILLAPGIALLGIVAAAGTTLGIRDRLKEYR